MITDFLSAVTKPFFTVNHAVQQVACSAFGTSLVPVASTFMQNTLGLAKFQARDSIKIRAVRFSLPYYFRTGAPDSMVVTANLYDFVAAAGYPPDNPPGGIIQFPDSDEWLDLGAFSAWPALMSTLNNRYKIQLTAPAVNVSMIGVDASFVNGTDVSFEIDFIVDHTLDMVA